MPPKEMYGNTDITLFDKFTETLFERENYKLKLQKIKEIITDEDENDKTKLKEITKLIDKLSL